MFTKTLIQNQLSSIEFNIIVIHVKMDKNRLIYKLQKTASFHKCKYNLIQMPLFICIKIVSKL